MGFNYKKKDKKYIANTYNRFDVFLKEGENATLYDADGFQYIDFTSGIGVNSLGAADKKWAKAVSKQASRLQHASNLYYTKPCITAAQKLCRFTAYDKVFFSNSGAEANECAIKAARKYSYEKYGRKRTTILTLKNSFHGRTITTLSATGQESFHDFFFPFTDGFCYAEANDLRSFYHNCTEDVCAVMVEFIQGEGGVIPLDEEYIRTVHAFCRENDILFIADEVQTGTGRTGTFLASEQYYIFPDITTLAKGLGNGLPVGATLFSEKVSGVLGPGQHGSTFGGNPIACAGVNVVLDRVCDEDFLNEVAEKGEYMKSRLESMPYIESVTGKGLMLGASLSELKVKDVAERCAEWGLLVLTAKEKLRFLPPLTITYDELDEGLEILESVLSSFDEGEEDDETFA